MVHAACPVSGTLMSVFILQRYENVSAVRRLERGALELVSP